MVADSGKPVPPRAFAEVIASGVTPSQSGGPPLASPPESALDLVED